MLLDPKAGVLVQEGSPAERASRMVEDSLAYGSNIVAGVTPGKGGQRVHGDTCLRHGWQRRLKSIRRLSALFLSPRLLCLMRAGVLRCRYVALSDYD